MITSKLDIQIWHLLLLLLPQNFSFTLKLKRPAIRALGIFSNHSGYILNGFVITCGVPG